MSVQNALLDPDVVAERLGVSLDTVYRLMRDRKLPYTQVAPRKRVVTEDQLDEYIRAQAVPAAS